MPKQPRTRFATALRRYRTITREGLRQDALAAELHVHAITLSRWELDKSPVRDDWQAHRLEQLIGVAPPRTREELSEQLADALREWQRPGGSRGVVAELSEEGSRPSKARPTRRPRGGGHA